MKNVYYKIKDKTPIQMLILRLSVREIVTQFRPDNTYVLQTNVFVLQLS